MKNVKRSGGGGQLLASLLLLLVLLPGGKINTNNLEKITGESLIFKRLL